MSLSAQDPHRGFSLGPLRGALSLDGRLQAVSSWLEKTDPPVSPDLTLSLIASEKEESAFAWFGDTLIGRGCRLRRVVHAEGTETISGTCYPSEQGLMHALRFATQPLLLRRGWILIHAASVCLSGGVHVFAGPSKAGKSTLARRFREAGVEVLGEEIALVGEGRVLTHPSQRRAGRGGGALAGLHFLEQGGSAERTPISGAEALRRLLSLTMVYEQGREAAARVLMCAEAVLTQTPADRFVVPEGEVALAPWMASARRVP